MKDRQSEKRRTLIVTLCITMTILAAGLGATLLYFLFSSGNAGVQREETAESEWTSEKNGELFGEDVEEAHTAFDEETGLQYADNQLLLTAAPGVTRADVEELAAPYQAEIVGMIAYTNVYQLKFPEAKTKEELERIGEELCQNSEIESYEKNTVMDMDVDAVYPKDEKWADDWKDSAPAGKNWGMEAIHAPEAWDYTDQMREVNVGVYDNMFYDHEDLSFQDILCNMHGKDLNDSHGTHVSGTIGATFDERGVCGVFPKANLYGASFARVEKTYNSLMGMKIAFTYLIAQAKCKVINLSLEWTEEIFAASRGNEAAILAIKNGAKQLGDYLQLLLDIDAANDFVICKAAGNDNSAYEYIEADAGDEDAPYGYIFYKDNNKKRYEKYENNQSGKKFSDRVVTAQKTGCVRADDYISAIPNEEVKKRILVVGAVKNLGQGNYEMADFSNCGDRVDVVAPGVDIYSTVKAKEYQGGLEWSGTSMAAPHVSGIAAMCFAVNEDLSGAEVAKIIRETAEGKIRYAADQGTDSYKKELKKYAYPLVNAEKAVKKALAKKNRKPEAEKEDVSRDIILVLDRSGSMEGEPLAQTKEAALKFVDTVFEKDARVSVVTYDTTAVTECGLTDDQQELTADIEDIDSGDMTNMYAGLVQADEILQNSQADRKILVLMSDGLPNEGASDGYDYSPPLLRYAEEMKNRGYYLYTLGFFTDLNAEERYSAQQLMEGIASPRLHYEVDSAEDLVFFFDDIANQIAGTQYVYIRIACPVDVTVRSNGEVLSSKAENENTRTSFGALTYENIQEENEGGGYGSYGEADAYGGYDSFYEEAGSYSGYDNYDENSGSWSPAGAWNADRAKVLRLNMDEDYDVEIEGYDSGTMNYTVSFPNEKGEYDDVREFPDIAVTASTKAISNTGAAGSTYLKVDENGDGKYDTTYETKANGKMEEVKDYTVLYIVLIAVGVALILLLLLILVLVHTSKKKKRPVPQRIAGDVYGAFGVFQGYSHPMSLGSQCVVGRKSTCDIQLVHGQVSRVHCVIQMLPDGVYQVTDHSSNGTFYNNQRLKKGEPYRLPKGALLAIGDADNVLELR